MPDDVKAVLTVTHSENDDYSNPEWVSNWDAYEVDPDEVINQKVEAALSGGTTIGISYLASVTFLAIKNTDSTNFVTVTWTDSAANANVQKVPAGGLFAVPDVDPSATFKITADTAVVICKIVITGT